MHSEMHSAMKLYFIWNCDMKAVMELLQPILD